MSQIDTLPPLRDVIARHELNAKKSLGQNFLLDLNLTTKIAKVAGALVGITVVEVGAGPGGLTRALLAAGAAKVIAIEKDHRAIAALHEIALAYPGRLEIVEGDALTYDPAPHLQNQKVRIIANLPYNVATPLLIGWLTQTVWPPWFESLTLMFQKEVAERMTAPPGSKVYGRLSVLVQALCHVDLAFDVPKEAFVPPPKITSSVVYLQPRADRADVPRRALQDVTRAAFGQRRRMLRQSLKLLNIEPEQLLAPLNIDPQKRAEQLQVEDFIAMAKVYADISK